MNWMRRITQLCTVGMGILLYVQVVSGAAADSTSITPIGELERWSMMVERLGFCLVGFGILAYMMYRQSALEGITKRYDDTQQAHLLAFREINETCRTMMRDTKDTILLAVQVQSTMVAKLDSMEKKYGK